MHDWTMNIILLKQTYYYSNSGFSDLDLIEAAKYLIASSTSAAGQFGSNKS